VTSIAQTENSYGTAAERAYLEGLAKKPHAVALLRNYIAAADKRVVWNSIDKAKAVAHAHLLLIAVLGVDNLPRAA
jgi:hypothetical protein